MREGAGIAAALRRLADAIDEFEMPERPVHEGPKLRRLLSYGDAAQYLGCSKRGLVNLANEGHVRRTRIGSRVLFDVESLDEYINALRDR